MNLKAQAPEKSKVQVPGVTSCIKFFPCVCLPSLSVLSVDFTPSVVSSVLGMIRSEKTFEALLWVVHFRLGKGAPREGKPQNGDAMEVI